MHIPVLSDYVAELLVKNVSGNYLDCTLGCGGHSEKIVSLLSAGGFLTGIDIDREALEIARIKLKGYSDRIRIIKMSYTRISGQFPESSFDGILFDFGLSSLQLDSTSRGFSFRYDSPADMRMDQEAGKTAADLLNTASADELSCIFSEYGGIRKASRLAESIVLKRRTKKFVSVSDILSALEVCGLSGIKSSARAFQALRIAVNSELENIKTALPAAFAGLKKNGRLVTIAYHSGEDRIIKYYFSSLKDSGAAVLVAKKTVSGDSVERGKNSRARSAVLRCIGKQ